MELTAKIEEAAKTRSLKIAEQWCRKAQKATGWDFLPIMILHKGERFRVAATSGVSSPRMYLSK